MSPLITRINELSQLARQAWFTQLAFLAFIGVTLLSVQDADLLVLSRKTQLPLVGIESQFAGSSSSRRFSAPSST